MNLERLNLVNDVKVYSVRDEFFASYGKVIDADFSELTSWLNKNTAIPESGNIYVPSASAMEQMPIASQIIKNELYGGMDIQIGYCNGRNTTYNGFEYHKGSEINVAATDFMLVLGHIWEIKDNTYKVEDARVFFVEEGTAIEMYQTTLHLSPCRTTDSGFRDVVVLPKGTNTPLAEKPSNPKGEARLLLQKNKWVIAHPNREPLIKQGAFAGLIGENKELHY